MSCEERVGETPLTNDSQSRRQLLVRAAEACMLAAFSPVISACASLTTLTVRPTGGQLELPLARHPELNGGQGALRVLPAGHPDPIYVLAQVDGSFIALSPICTHRGCTVDVQADRLVCPCHGSTYDRTGRVLRGPAERALARYPVQVTESRVLVIDLRGAT
jgi:Rieske Fe-S protein